MSGGREGHFDLVEETFILRIETESVEFDQIIGIKGIMIDSKVIAGACEVERNS